MQVWRTLILCSLVFTGVQLFVLARCGLMRTDGVLLGAVRISTARRAEASCCRSTAVGAHVCSGDGISCACSRERRDARLRARREVYSSQMTSQTCLALRTSSAVPHVWLGLRNKVTRLARCERIVHSVRA